MKKHLFIIIYFLFIWRCTGQVDHSNNVVTFLTKDYALKNNENKFIVYRGEDFQIENEHLLYEKDRLIVKFTSFDTTYINPFLLDSTVNKLNLLYRIDSMLYLISEYRVGIDSIIKYDVGPNKKNILFSTSPFESFIKGNFEFSDTISSGRTLASVHDPVLISLMNFSLKDDKVLLDKLKYKVYWDSKTNQYKYYFSDGHNSFEIIVSGFENHNKYKFWKLLDSMYSE